MSKRIVMSVLMSAVASIVVSVGTCGMNKGNDRVTLAVQFPDTCFMTSPKPIADGLSLGGVVVSVKPGPTKFEFDCNGNQVSVTRNVEEGQMTMTLDPTK